MAKEVMREIVTVEAFDRWLLVVAIVGVPLGIGAGFMMARRWAHPRRWQLGVLTGFLLGLLCPLLYGLWRFYLWRIRIDLDRNFVGLHRVDVLVGNLLLFSLVGALVGVLTYLYGRWLQRQLEQS